MAGYIGPAPVPQATQNREAFTATSNQTSFATSGYTPQFIDVYLNGVKLAAADYTATNGSDVVLASGATVGDILEVVAFSAFTVADQAFTGTTTVDNLTVTGTTTLAGADITGTLTSDGLTVDSGSGANQLTLARSTTYSGLSWSTLISDFGGGGSDLIFDSTGANTGYGFRTRDSGDVIGKALVMSPNRDISFYEDTGTTAKFFWDASAESLGLGTTSPTADIHMVKADDINEIIMDANRPSAGQLLGRTRYYWNGTEVARMEGDAGSDTTNKDDGILRFLTRPSGSSIAEAMRIDSSGHLQLSGSTDNVIRSGLDSSRVRIFGGGTESVGNGAALTLQGVDHLGGNYADLASGTGGYINFRIGTSNAMRIDSSGRVLIGTTSSFADVNSDDLQLSGSGDTGMIIKSGTSSYGSIYFGDATSGGARNAGIVRYQHGSDNMQFWTSATERMRIDSSGNLLVGKAAVGNDVGAEFRSIGYSSFTRDGNNVLTVRRKTSNGDIVQFEKDTTVVGSIGSSTNIAGNFFIAGDSGLQFRSDDILPTNGTGAYTNGALDLGDAGAKFRNIYLSGGVVFGDAGGSGTSTSNTFDSYEAGTFTPTVGSSGWVGVYQSSNKGAYVKTGNCVNFNFSLDLNSTSTQPTGSVVINGLPFASHSSSSSQGSPRFTLHFYNVGFGSASSSIPLGYIPTTSSTQVKILYSRDGTTWVVANHGGSANQINLGSGRALIVVNGHYFTDA